MKRKKLQRRDKELSFKSLKKLRVTLRKFGLLNSEPEENKELGRYNKKYGIGKNIKDKASNL